MIAIPAIDLREGACVQLVGGDFDDERVRLPDPLAVAERWRAAGFRRLHVVDLDAATERGTNTGVVERLLALPGLTVQVGGGLKDAVAIDRVVNAPDRLAIVGSRAVTDPDWLAEVAGARPGRLVVAADVRGREVLVRGWSRGSGIEIAAFLDRVRELPLAGLLVTAVHREGRLDGPDLALIEDVASRAGQPVLASGGIASLDDLRDLDRAGAAGAVIGMALYSGALDARAVVEEFGR